MKFFVCIFNSTKGVTSYFGSSFAALAGANYLLRNHATARHAMNWGVIGTETFLIVHNARHTFWNQRSRMSSYLGKHRRDRFTLSFVIF